MGVFGKMLLYRPLPQEPLCVYILGAGNLGSRAAVETAARWPSCELHIADIRTSIPDDLPGIHHTGTEAMDLLCENLDQSSPDDIVIPCIPVHAAFNWVLSHLGFCIPVPVRLMEKLPGAVVGVDGCIYSALSDFNCPDDCPEPAGYCTISGEERGSPMYEIMASIQERSYSALAVRSVQLFPGIAAITSGILFDLLNEARRKKGRYLISTASKCIGVVHGFIH